MTPRKKVTDATKAKLPLPKGHPQKRQTKRKRCPSCEKMVSVGPHDIHTCYDAKALRAIELNETSGRTMQGFTPSPIAGQPLPTNPPTEDAPDFRAKPWALDDPNEPFESPYARARVIQARLDARRFMPEKTSTAGTREPLYDTRPYPWDIRRWLSNKLTALAKWVAP